MNKEKPKLSRSASTVYAFDLFSTIFQSKSRSFFAHLFNYKLLFNANMLGIRWMIVTSAPKILLPMTRNMLYVEACMHDIPVNFLFHPSEAVREIGEEMTADTTAKNGLKHILSHQLRAKMKMKNLNIHALDLLECEIQFWYKHHANFMQIRNACISNKK